MLSIRWLRGAPLLLISLYMLYSHFSERSERQLVLAEGRSASAIAHEPSDLEYVTVSWTDDAGRQHSGRAWTRKGFAQRFLKRAGAANSRVDIKYISEFGIAPVILSEVAEREWADTFGIYASFIMSLFATILMVFEYRKTRREQRALA